MTYIAEYKPTTFNSNLSRVHFTQQPTLAEVFFQNQVGNPLELYKVNILHSSHSAT